MRLPNGYGSVSKMSGNRRNSYRVRITIGRNDETGAVIQKSLGYYRTKDEALEALREYNANPYDLTAEKLTFSDVYSRWVKSDSFKELGEKAADHYRLAYEHCAPLHGLPILDIHLLQLQTLMDTCELDYTPKKYIRELCQKLFTFAERYGAVNDNPALRVDIGKRKRKISSSSPIKNKKNEQITLFDLELSKEPAVQEAQQSISEIDGMDGHEFEYFCAELMEKNGF